MMVYMFESFCLSVFGIRTGLESSGCVCAASSITALQQNQTVNRQDSSCKLILYFFFLFSHQELIK